MGKAILVTGSSQGIGLGILNLFANRGFHVCINYAHDDHKAQLAKDDLEAQGATVSLHKCDVRDHGKVAEMFAAIASLGHSLETVVVNAVDEIPKPIDEVSFEEWHAVLLTKLDGAFLTTKHAIPLLAKADNPCIIYVTSEDGVRPDGDYIAYQVGTAGLIAMMIANSQYLAKKYRIRVNAVSPGPVRTNLWEKAGQSEEMWVDLGESSPMGRVAKVDDVAQAVWYLAQDSGRFLNGTTVNVDGGSRWS